MLRHRSATRTFNHPVDGATVVFADVYQRPLRPVGEIALDFKRLMQTLEINKLLTLAVFFTVGERQGHRAGLVQ